jgi:hypothetical protein
MKKLLTITAFMLATLAWAAAQQPGAGQAGSLPGASQSQRPMPGSADQNAPQSGMQAGSQDQVANAPITEGCLGGSAPNFTITDNAGTTYKLNIPPNADTSKLTPHVGESVQVQGNVRETGKSTGSIDVQGIGRGTGKCPAGGSTAVPTPPKQ